MGLCHWEDFKARASETTLHKSSFTSGSFQATGCVAVTQISTEPTKQRVENSRRDQDMDRFDEPPYPFPLLAKPPPTAKKNQNEATNFWPPDGNNLPWLRLQDV